MCAITTQECQTEQIRRLDAKTQDQRMVTFTLCGSGQKAWQTCVKQAS